MKTAAKYKIHRTLSIIVVPFLLLSILTGFFRANQQWIWPEGYKKKKVKTDFVVKDKLVSLNLITTKIDSLSENKNYYKDIFLKAENEQLLYQVNTGKEKYLIDAYTGKIISPIEPGFAKSIASQYVNGKPEVISCTLLKDYLHRKTKEKKIVYEICFRNEIHSCIYLDYRTGEIVEDLDDRRDWGIWIIRLHDYDFFDAKKGITNTVSIGMVLAAISGIWIYRIRTKKKVL